MSGPRSAPPGEPFAQVAETHSAAVFFAGGWAFKVKKPVDLGFLDFTSPQAREAACHAEVDLNRRFAPDVYTGVGELKDPAGRMVEHLVMMRRMPASRRLSSLVTAREPVAGPLREVARTLAAAHAASPRRTDMPSRAAGMPCSAGGVPTSPRRGRCLSPRSARPSSLTCRNWPSGSWPAGSRSSRAGCRSGRIVDGHGDLLADDIFCLDDRPRILDCLDFDDLLRWLDGLDDDACLAMDLEHVGAAGLAQQFTRWYAEFAADPAPPVLLHHYIAYRAFMRAKVTALRAGQGDPGAADEARRSAARAVAAGAAADLVQLRCTVPAGVAEQRVGARREKPARGARADDPSDASPEILRRMAVTADP